MKLFVPMTLFAAVLIQGTALADGLPIQGAFAVTYASTPNTSGASYCDPTHTVLPIAVEAHGDGFTSLGALSLFLQKGLSATGVFQGCLTLIAANGDTLTAIYTAQGTAPNSNNFSAATGMLVFTGGTGRFHGATGNAKFTATFANIYPASSFLSGGTAPLQGMAYYVIEGSVSLREND
jgi:hypothetical protein